MNDIITTIVEGFQGIITGFTGGITSGVSSLLFEGTGESRVLTDFAKFGFTFLGLGMAVGIVYFIVRMVRH